MRSGAAILFVATAAAVCAQDVTFSEHIAPIIYANCSRCHRPGEVSPFSLLSYQDVAKRGGFDLSGPPEFAVAGAKYRFLSGASNHAHRMATVRDVVAEGGQASRPAQLAAELGLEEVSDVLGQSFEFPFRGGNIAFDFGALPP